MKKIPIRFLPLIFIFIFPFCITWKAAAHGDEPRLELSAENLNPGATLGIRGVQFEIETLIRLSLVGENFDHSLGEVTTDLEGEFNLYIAIPTDLHEGVYRVRAVSSEHDLTSLPLSVSGLPIPNQEEGQRLEGDSLFIPMPAQPSSSIIPTTAIGRSLVQESPPSNMWIAIVLGAVSILLIMVYKLLKKF